MDKQRIEDLRTMASTSTWYRGVHECLDEIEQLREVCEALLTYEQGRKVSNPEAILFYRIAVDKARVALHREESDGREAN